MKALILSGGTGTRLRPLTHTSTKQLLPVANRPILFHVIDSMKDNAMITDIGIIISPETGAEVIKAVDSEYDCGVNIRFIMQDKPAGLAHAVKTARHWLKDSDFIMFLGDNLIQDDLRDILLNYGLYHKSKNETVVFTKQVSDPSRFGVVEFENGKVSKLVEKPKEPKSNHALIGMYILNKDIHIAIDNIKPSFRNELEITDALQWLLENGYPVFNRTISGWWLDTGKKDDMLEANNKVLTRSGNIIGKSSHVKGCWIIPPVVIGNDCEIINAHIGPYVSIGNGTKVSGLPCKAGELQALSKISNSIVLENCEISGTIVDSIIGNRCKVMTDHETSLMLGDDSKVEEKIWAGH